MLSKGFSGVCGDTVIEPDKQIFVFFSNVAGADCSLEGTCNAVATIVNDDGPPGIRINDISVSTVAGLAKNVSITSPHPDYFSQNTELD